MSGNPWHRRYHSDALAGILSLTLEERGAYQTVLDMIYDHGGAIADNDRILAAYMGCSIRKWKTIKSALIDAGKLTLSGGRLSNARAEKEIENDAKTSRKHAENGSRGGRARSENRKNTNENSETAQAPLKPASSLLPEARSQSTPLDKSNGRPAATDKAFWSTAKSYLGEAGVRNPGALIGKWCRDYGQPEAAKGIAAAQIERAVDPVPYIERVLRGAANDSEQWEFTGPC